MKRPRADDELRSASRRPTLRLCAAAVGLGLSLGAAAAPPAAPRAPEPLNVPRLEGQLTIDGVLDEAAWRSALVLHLQYETEPGDNRPPSAATEVLLITDEETLFAAFRCHDPDPSALQAHLTDREACLDDDHVTIHLDTFNDERRHYTIGANALGVQMDAMATNDSYDWSWDAIFDAAGRPTAWGYVVEIAVPFNQLKFQHTEGPQIWGFDAWRIYPRNLRRVMAVAPKDRDNDGYESQMVKIEGFLEARPGKSLELNPTLTAVGTEAREDAAGEFLTSVSEAEAGLTLSWGMTPNLGLSATYNPDFSQVEADARQMDINQPFALYYDEKRPFFLEAKDHFSSPLVNLIHTRTLRDPEWGLKIAGRVGANGLGAFVVEDDRTNILIPGSQSSRGVALEESSQAAAVRFFHNLGERYTFGATLTNRDSGDYFNRTLGADAVIRLSESDRLRMQVVGSATRYPGDVAEEFAQPEGEFRDRAFDITYSHMTGEWYWWASTENYGRDFRADLGYVPKVDYRIYKGAIGRDWRPDNAASWYTRLRGELMYAYEEDQDGELLMNRADLFGLYEGPLQSTVAARLYQAETAFNGEVFDVTYFGTYTGFRPRPNILVGLDTSFGDKIDYANTRLGRRVRLQPELTWSVGRHWTMELDYHYERLAVDGQRLYRAAISQGSFSYQFNVTAMLRATLQHVDYRYTPELYEDPMPSEEKSLFTQLLFSYKLNPRTVIFVGYSDNHVGDAERPLSQLDRTVFAKIGYAWQL